MKISYNWLKEYIDFSIEPAEVARILTTTGLEVEGVEEFESVKGGLKGVVVGKVLACKKHPDADKLSITTVDIGASEPVQIICGAPNVAAGQTVPVATEGATLYPSGNSDGFTIKRTKIRGEISCGMICAEDELGLGSDHDGIMILEDRLRPGTPAAEYFGVEKDFVFEIGLTPNRIDGASHIGVARDLAAYLTQNGKPLKLKKPLVDPFSKDNNDLTLEVSVLNREACPRYSGITLTQLKVKDSPEWLKNRLLAIGQEPINNVVDITNYVLHETGQPLHAFDAKKIKGNKVIVRTLDEGTSFFTLDGKERKLTSQDLMICDSEGGMCIGGVFGGSGSGVTEETTAIFLESACFDPVYIRKTSKYHLLNTDASFRFERGTDPNGTVYALKRAARLMKEIAGGKISSDIMDIYPEPVEDFIIPVSFPSMNRLIGMSIDPKVITSILESLDIRVEKLEKEGMVLRVPPYRVDVKREADIVEEVLRIFGYDNVDFDAHVNSTISYTHKPDKEKVIHTISDMLSAMGFMEIKSNSLTRENYFAEDDASVVKIQNALSQDLSRLRKSLLPGGLEALIYNMNRKRSDLKMYEFGNCYFYDPGKNETNHQKNYREELRLGIFLSGHYNQDTWNTTGEPASFHHLKSVADRILGKLGIQYAGLKEDELTNDEFDQSLAYSDSKGWVLSIGKVSNKLLRAFDIKQEVFAAEFNWDRMMKLHGKSRILFRPIPKFQEVRRDLSLLLEHRIKFRQIEQLAYNTERKLLKEISLFDVYEGEKIEQGKKSYAISFVLLDEEKTLTDKQIDKVMEKISRALEKELGAVVRGA